MTPQRRGIIQSCKSFPLPSFPSSLTFPRINNNTAGIIKVRQSYHTITNSIRIQPHIVTTRPFKSNINMKLSSPSSCLLLAYYSLTQSSSSSQFYASALASPIKMSAATTTTTTTPTPPLTTASKKIAEHIPLATEAMSYFDSSPDPFHAVQSTIALLEKAGFENIHELDKVNGDANKNVELIPGGKYYLTKNKSSIIAFAIGKKFDPSNLESVASGGFKIVGAHTDSPNIKIKPYSKRGSNGYRQLAVQCYGGALW